MLFGWFKKKQKNCLGIDLGSSGVKIAELAPQGENRLALVNYGIAQTELGSAIDTSAMSADQLAFLLQKIFERAGIKTRQAVVSLSVSDTFSTIIDLPWMPENELAQAIPFQAKKYVPVPIEEVVFDWSVVGEYTVGLNASAPVPSAGTDIQPQKAAGGATQGKVMQILIVAVPQDVIKKIAQIAKKINLDVLAIEQEAFSIVRSLVGKDEGTYLVIDLGQSNTDLIIIDKGAIRLTYTFEKNKPLDLVTESLKIINLHQIRYNRKIARIILTGGGAEHGEWAKTLATQLGAPIGVGNPFARLVSDPRLEKAFKEISPFMSVAIGGAMREI